MKYFGLFIIGQLIAIAMLAQPESITMNSNSKGSSFNMEFTMGKSHNHPSFAVWLQDMEGRFIQTLFVTQSVGTGVYPFKPAGSLKWEKGPGEASRPAALPYWFHNRLGIEQGDVKLPSKNKPVADAYTGATPKSSFVLNLKSDKPINGKVRLLVEFNQPWDVNDYWTNAKHPENPNYLTSCQPALIYAVTIDFNNLMDSYHLNPIGHSHPYGADGKLYTNLSTFSTALDIFKEIKVEAKK